MTTFCVLEISSLSRSLRATISQFTLSHSHQPPDKPLWSSRRICLICFYNNQPSITICNSLPPSLSAISKRFTVLSHLLLSPIKAVYSSPVAPATASITASPKCPKFGHGHKSLFQLCTSLIARKDPP